jgi:flagellar biosynthesis/type III secretory pathway protein FliH
VAALETEFTNHPPLKGTADWYIESSNEVDRGSCMVETESGLVDARFSTQLETLGKLMKTARLDE